VVTLRRSRVPDAARAALRACALVMAVLAVLPFTAPFSTCKLGVFVTTQSVHGNAPVPGESRGPSIADAIVYLASVADKDTLKNLASAPSVHSRPAPLLLAGRPLPFTSSDQASLGLVSSSVLRI
jgi:hypothetical protein